MVPCHLYAGSFHHEIQCICHDALPVHPQQQFLHLVLKSTAVIGEWVECGCWVITSSSKGLLFEEEETRAAGSIRTLPSVVMGLVRSQGEVLMVLRSV